MRGAAHEKFNTERDKALFKSRGGSILESGEAEPQREKLRRLTVRKNRGQYRFILVSGEAQACRRDTLKGRCPVPC
jgi:hypothetical protein